jgi:hypothetical protein
LDHVNLEPVIRLPTAWSSVSGNFVVHLFEGTVTVAEMDRMQQLGDAHSARHPAKRVELVVVHSSDARMTGDERTRMARLIKHGDAYRTATATVILAEGLVGALHRSTLTALLMVARPPHPTKVFGHVAEAMRWLWPQLRALQPTAPALEQLEHELVAHLAEFRARSVRA